MIRYALYLARCQWPYAVTVAIVTGFLVRPEWIWLWASLLAAWVLAWGIARSVRLRRQRETARKRIAVIAAARRRPKATAEEQAARSVLGIGEHYPERVTGSIGTPGDAHLVALAAELWPGHEYLAIVHEARRGAK